MNLILGLTLPSPGRRWACDEDRRMEAALVHGDVRPYIWKTVAN